MLRVVIWLGGEVVAHDANLAPPAVVGCVAVGQAPPLVRRWGRFGVLVLAAVVVVVLVLILATGGLRT
ncbi:MAG: hypothetical protein ABI083_05050 [Lapillicoccus sp.]